MSPLDPFTRHPASVGESYGQHFASAGGFGLKLLGAGLACLVHAVLPFLFVRTGSAAVTRLHDAMVANRMRKPGRVGTGQVSRA
jgi:hypothetical protein